MTTDDIFMGIACGNGIGLMAHSMLDRRIGNLCAVVVEDCTPAFGIALVWRKDDENPVLQELLAHMN